jgi:deoxyribose-phosphate aldolase
MTTIISKHIDYTILKPGTTRQQVEAICHTAVEQSYKAVCIPACYIRTARRNMPESGDRPMVCTVAGFPHGMELSQSKFNEVLNNIREGAEEVDMVSNAAMIKSEDWISWKKEVKMFAALCASSGVTSKLIIETSLLDDHELVRICELVQETDLDFVKTSTGFVGEGAQFDIVKRMRALLPQHMLIKASGGIRDGERARKFIEAGAERIGTSSLIL